MKPLSVNAPAIALRVPISRITEIVNAKHAILGDTALRLARYFGTTPEFRMNLQAKYDLKIVKDEMGQKLSGRSVHAKLRLSPAESPRLQR